MKGIKFVSFILASNEVDRMNRLRIPRAFAQTYLDDGYGLSNATLIDRSRRSWSVSVGRIGNNLYFQEGWRDFFLAHGLDVGDILIFDYTENMTFNVRVVDRCCAEITCFSFTASTGRCQNCDRERTRPAFIEVFTYDEFTSEFPHFKKRLSRSAIGPPWLMSIPLNFAEEIPAGATAMTLLTTNGGEWIVTCLNQNRNLAISSGWSQFAQDNELKVDDGLVFEKLKQTEFMVHIFKADE